MSKSLIDKLLEVLAAEKASGEPEQRAVETPSKDVNAEIISYMQKVGRPITSKDLMSDLAVPKSSSNKRLAYMVGDGLLTVDRSSSPYKYSLVEATPDNVVEAPVTEVSAVDRYKLNDSKMKAVINIAKQHGHVSTALLVKYLGMGKGRAMMYLQGMSENGSLVKIGPKPYKYYIGENIEEEIPTTDPANFSEIKYKWDDKVLEYLRNHNGVLLKRSSISKALGMKGGVIYTVIANMQKRGLLDENLNILGESKQTDDRPKEVVTEGKTKDPLADQIEFLIWTFIRETRNTDVLQFLTWLESKSK